MPRYGGGKENFDEQSKKLDAIDGRLTDIERKEGVVADGEEKLGKATDANTQKRRVNTAAKKEGADVTERAAAVANEEAKAIDVSTASIERNRIARERRAAATEREAVNAQRAARGAQDPLFAAAYGVDPLSQHALRRELGVGQGRAANLQAAVRSIPDPNVYPGALTRVQAAERAIVQADIDLAAAKKGYKRAIDAGDLAAAEAAKADRIAAEASQASARAELESAHSAIELAEARRVEISRLAEQQIVSGNLAGLAPALARTGAAPGGLGEVARQIAASRAAQEAIVSGNLAGLAPGAAKAPSAPAGGVGGTLASHYEAQAAAAAQATAAADAHAAAMHIDEQAQLANAQAASAVARENIAETITRNTGALRQQGVALATVSQAMHKHGALTSEFILAAARGETTLRELGNQALITAGKFGGWTAAAGGLFAAAGAIKEIGKGAIESSGGVHTLQRVINQPFTPSQAQGAFRDLAKEFNVPIETAVDAVYRMGQRFHSLPQAVEAARASLYSFKTGEVDVATSTENLLAIVNGFGLSSKDLASVYDQINQAQNTFGIRIGDTEAGLAKAAGTYRNAGGDLNYLLGLTVAISRATNRSGQEIGTGIARGVNEIRKSVNQAKLEAQGVTVIPDNFQKTLQNALRVAQNNPRADRQQIASGLFGNQYARLIAPVLRDQKVLNAALSDTSPEKSKGSAQRELAKVMQQADEQIHKVGITLQRLGAALSDAGAFKLAGALLVGLNSVLDLAVKIVDIFNLIPSPFRETLTIMGELMLTLKLLQRFGATNRLQGTPLGFLANPDQQYAARARSGLRGARDAAFDEQESTQRAAYRQTRVYESAKAEAEAAMEAEAHLLNDENATTQQKIDAADRTVKTSATLTRAEERMIAATNAAQDARLQAAAADEEYAALRGLSNKEVAARAREGVPVPRSIDRPSSEGVENAVVRTGATTNLEEVDRQRQAVNALGNPAAERELTARAQRVEGALRARADAMAPMIRAGGNLGTAVNAGIDKTVVMAGRVTDTLTRVPGKLTGLRAGLANIARTLGPLDIALIGLIGFSLLDEQLSKLTEDLDKAGDDLGKIGYHDPKAARTKLDANLKTLVQGGQGIGGRTSDFLSELNDKVNPVNLLSTLGKEISGNYESARQKRERLIQENQQDQEHLDLIQDLQGRARAAGTAIPQQTYKQATDRIKHDQELRRAGLISQREFDHRMALHAIEVTTLLDPTAADVRKGATAVANANRVAGSLEEYTKSLRKLDPDTLAAQVGALASEIGTFGGNNHDLNRLQAAYGEQARRWVGSSSPADIQKLMAAREAYITTITNMVQAELKVALAHNFSPASRQAAYSNAAASYQRLIVLNAQRQLAGQQGKVAQAETAVARIQDNINKGGDYNYDNTFMGIPIREGVGVPELRARLIKAKEHLANVRKKAGAFTKEVDAAGKVVAGLAADMRDAALQDYQSGTQTTLDLEQSRTRDPVTAAREAVKKAQEDLAYARAHFKARSDQVRKAIAALNNADKALADALTQAAQDIGDAQDDLAAARAGDDPIAVAQAAQNKAARAMAGAKNRSDRTHALADTIRANNQMEQAVRDREAARIDVLESTTTDPVTQAHDEVRKAQAALRGTTGAARLTAQAALNRARTAARDAELQAREGDIDFELQMGQVSNSQAITMYQRLLQIRNLSKQQRRDILLKIHQLKSDAANEASGFDLDVGSLKLPTIYDVRRAFDPIRRQVHDSQRSVLAEAGAQSAHIRNNVNHMYSSRAEVQANVTVIVRDRNAAGEVFSAIDRALGTTLRARMRSQRLRGAA